MLMVLTIVGILLMAIGIGLMIKEQLVLRRDDAHHGTLRQRQEDAQQVTGDLEQLLRKVTERSEAIVTQLRFELDQARRVIARLEQEKVRASTVSVPAQELVPVTTPARELALVPTQVPKLASVPIQELALVPKQAPEPALLSTPAQDIEPQIPPTVEQSGRSFSNQHIPVVSPSSGMASYPLRQYAQVQALAKNEEATVQGIKDDIPSFSPLPEHVDPRQLSREERYEQVVALHKMGFNDDLIAQVLDLGRDEVKMIRQLRRVE